MGGRRLNWTVSHSSWLGGKTLSGFIWEQSTACSVQQKLKHLRRRGRRKVMRKTFWKRSNEMWPPRCSLPPSALLHIPLPSADLACPTGGGGSSSTVIFSKGRIWAAARAAGQLFLIWSWPGDDPPVGAPLSGKTKTPAPSKGAPWQRWRAGNRLAKGKQGNRRAALRNICTAFLCKKKKKLNLILSAWAQGT